MSTLGDGWRLSVGTLTAIPVRPPRRVDRAVAQWAMLLAPIATLPFALLPLLAHALVARAGMPPSLAAALVVAALAVGSRGLHLDGLADTADGFAASYDRERALTVMRAGNVGPTGVAAVVLVLLVQTAALSALVTSWGGAVVAAVAVVGSRHTLAWLCARWFRAARSQGLGATVAGSVATGWLIAGAALLVPVTWWIGPLAGGLGVAAAAALLAGDAAALVVARRAQLRIGGITGDILGAGVEVGLAAALTVAACF